MIFVLGYFWIMFLHFVGEMYFVLILMIEAPAFRIWGIFVLEDGP